MKKYTLRPDTLDYRDLIYRPRMFTLPTKVDLRKFCSEVEDQGQMGSCTANALVGNLEYLEKKERLAFTDLSRLFIYYNERLIEHDETEDSGATLRDGIKVLKSYGVCPEADWPYDEKLLFEKPNDKAYEEALSHRISMYERLKNLKDMRDCLASGFPFVFGIKVYESFEGADVAQSGVIPLPQPSEKFLGGHALLAVGYDDIENEIIFRNSWGKDWGMRGYGVISYSYLVSELAQDFWTIQKYMAQRDAIFV